MGAEKTNPGDAGADDLFVSMEQALSRMPCETPDQIERFRSIALDIAKERDDLVVAKPRDFSKIVRASNGYQVLFYVQPNGEHYILNQVVMLRDVNGSPQITMKVHFSSGTELENEAHAFEAFSKCDRVRADLVVKRIYEEIKGLS